MGMAWEPSRSSDSAFDEAEVPYQPRHAARPRFLRGLHPTRRARHELVGARSDGSDQSGRTRTGQSGH
jgi:hypothetical protein